MTVKYNDGPFRKKIRQLERASKDEIIPTLEGLKEKGKYYAKAIAPMDTGYTIRSIEGRVEPDRKGGKARIFIKPSMKYRPNDGTHRRVMTKNSNWRYPKFDLVRWMHESPRARSHITSGTPDFMYKTRDYLKGKVGATARKYKQSVIARVQG